MPAQITILVVVGIWLLALSLSLLWLISFFKRITKGISEADLKKILERLLTNQEKQAKETERLDKEIRKLVQEGTFHIQKVGMVRFNPFRDIGGEHSFTMALLDGRDSGIVLTGLHTRDRTRIYLKTVRGGKSEYELSAEEKKAIAKAQEMT